MRLNIDWVGFGLQTAAMGAAYLVGRLRLTLRWYRTGR